MKELIESFRHFLRRDLIYIIGGATVVSSILFEFKEMHTYNLSMLSSLAVESYIFIAVISYIVGIVSKEFFALVGSLGLTIFYCSIKKCKSPKKWVIWLFEICSGKKFGKNDVDKARIEIYKDESSFINAEIERIVSFMHLGSVLGSCFIIDSVFLYCKFSQSKVEMAKNDIDICSNIILCLFLLGIFLLIYNRYQNVQHMKYVIKAKQVINSLNKKTNKKLELTG